MLNVTQTQNFNEETIIVTSTTLTAQALKSIYTKEEIKTLKSGLLVVQEFPHMTFTVQRS